MFFVYIYIYIDRKRERERNYKYMIKSRMVQDKNMITNIH